MLMTSPTETALALAAAGAGAIFIYNHIINNITSSRTRGGVEKRRRAKVQKVGRTTAAARDSFRVRRSNLMAISGRGGVDNGSRHRGRRNGGGGGNRRHGRGGGGGDDGKQRGSRRRRDHAPPRDDEGCGMYSLPRELASALLERFVSLASYSISFLGYFLPPDKPNKNLPSAATTSSENTVDGTSRHYYDDVVVVGLDCEMVGGGRGGWKSLLARCSVVTLDRDEHKEDAPPLGNERDHDAQRSKHRRRPRADLEEDLVVLYDKYVLPRERITDYRTQWSGITKDTYNAKHNDRQSSSSPAIPIVSFDRCQDEISRLFSSIGGKRVVVVGHALENDFEALEIEHPQSLTRDTAYYRPYMRRVRKRAYPRKLSTLSEELLGIQIQQQSSSTTRSPSLLEAEGESDNGNADEKSSIKKATMVGHSSVEDAAAALRLYWHDSQKWERSLGHPLSGARQRQYPRSWPPLGMFLDGCNLPIGMRGARIDELLMANTPNNGRNGVDGGEGAVTTTISSETFRLTSRKRDNNHSSNNNISTVDWIPKFRSALSPGCAPELESISVMFDRAKFRNINAGGGMARGGSFDTRAFRLDSPNNASAKDHGSIRVEITEDGDSTDDVLFHRCCASDNCISDSASVRKMISLDEVIDILSSGDANVDDVEGIDVLPHYIVIRRKAGGTKTHRRLFDKLHLRRPNEGALCLSALTPGLRRDALRTARELQRARNGSIERVIECELRRRDDLHFVVVTDDVFLTERLVGSGAVLVLSFRQMESMW